MELSAIGEQVFAVESIVKKRVRKVGGGEWIDLDWPSPDYLPIFFKSLFFLCATFDVTSPLTVRRDATLDANEARVVVVVGD